MEKKHKEIMANQEMKHGFKSSNQNKKHMNGRNCIICQEVVNKLIGEAATSR